MLPESKSRGKSAARAGALRRSARERAAAAARPVITLARLCVLTFNPAAACWMVTSSDAGSGAGAAGIPTRNRGQARAASYSKDVPPEELVAAVKLVAAGEAPLDPSVTRAVIEEFLRRAPPPPKPGPSLTS
jgi:hypothetical protein